MRQENVYSAEFEYDAGDPAGYRSAAAPVGREVGGEELVVKVFELPPGESLCHYRAEGDVDYWERER